MRPNERRDSGQHDLFPPWLDQLVDMDPAVAKFGPAIDGQSAATHAQAKHVLKRRKPALIAVRSTRSYPIESSRKNAVASDIVRSCSSCPL